VNIWIAFVLGFVGSVHCAGMCGPLAISLPPSGRTATGFLTGRAAYNLGRIITYCFIGLIFGLIGKSFVLAGVQRLLSITIGVLLLTGLLASRKLLLLVPIGRLVEGLKFMMGRILRQRSITSMIMLGVLNGLLPCGLVYVAAGAATMTGRVLDGVQFMFLFGLGTFPMMFLMGLTQKLFPAGLRLKLVKMVPLSIFLLAMLLILRGMALGIPYVSPVLSGASCCGK